MWLAVSIRKEISSRNEAMIYTVILKDHSAFMGFAPMKNPKIAIAVYVENGGFGATYGVPIGALLMEQYLNGSLSEESEKKAKAIQEKVIDYGKDAR